MRFGDNEFHIVRGQGMAGVVRSEFSVSPSRLISDPDTLSCGPLAPLTDPDEWDRLRSAYLAEVEGTEPQGPTLWRRLVDTRERLASAEAIYLWLGPALGESLLTGFVLEAFDLLELDPQRLRLIDLEPAFEALGDRLPIDAFHSDLLELAGPWLPMDKSAEACYHQVWRAATAPRSSTIGCLRTTAASSCSCPSRTTSTRTSKRCAR